VGQQPVQLRRLQPGGPLRELTDQWQGPLQIIVVVGRFQLRQLQGAALAEEVAPQPPGYNFLRNGHYSHGGVANAPAYQLEISAFGCFPADTALSRAYPWLGFRIGVIGNL
jgi:hypothetical protein